MRSSYEECIGTWAFCQLLQCACGAN